MGGGRAGDVGLLEPRIAGDLRGDVEVLHVDEGARAARPLETMGLLVATDDRVDRQAAVLAFDRGDLAFDQALGLRRTRGAAVDLDEAADLDVQVADHRVVGILERQLEHVGQMQPRIDHRALQLRSDRRQQVDRVDRDGRGDGRRNIGEAGHRHVRSPIPDDLVGVRQVDGVARLDPERVVDAVGLGNTAATARGCRRRQC